MGDVTGSWIVCGFQRRCESGGFVLLRGFFLMNDSGVKEITDLSFWEWILKEVAHT